MASKQRILLLGVGNTLLGDEGFGVHAMRWLDEHYSWPENVRLVDGGTLGLLLMAELMECDLAIILDVALGGDAPGSCYRLDDGDLAPGLSFGQSMHQTAITDTLISCELAGYRPKAVTFALEPFDIASPRVELTPAAQKRLPEFCKTVIGELAKLGIHATAKN